MIVQQYDEHLFCITQREHARLSEKLYEKFVPEENHPVRTAVRHHDDGWTESDESPSVKNGSVVDYRSIPLEEHLKILRRSVEQSAGHHPYAGWLVSKHGCSFHRNKSGELVERFLSEQETKRQDLYESISPTVTETSDRDFDWLQFTDAVSLFVLDPWTETYKWSRAVPGTVTIHETTRGGFRLETDALPEDSLTLQYSYRGVSADAPEAESQFQHSLSRAPENTGNVTLDVG